MKVGLTLLLVVTAALAWTIALVWQAPGQTSSGASSAVERPHTDLAQVLESNSPVTSADAIPSLVALNLRGARLEAVLEGLDQPWAFEFIGPNEVLITEIAGRLLRYRFGEPQPTAISGLPEIAKPYPQSGLLDVALHPEFPENHRIYFSYTAADPSGRYLQTEVATAILRDDAVTSLRVILHAGPYGWSPSNFGGALEFDADGYLYVSVGDRSEDQVAQDGTRLQGKILRLHDDGRVPGDNPFIDDPRIDDRIYALGVRNPQGLAFDPVRGVLFETEHGPLGGDEVNRIEAGANYGWPVLSYGNRYDGGTFAEDTHREGMEQPLFHYLPSIATSPVAVVRGSMFPEWEGDLLVGALRGQHVSRLDLDGLIVRSEYPILGELSARIRDIKVAPDGAVLVLTQAGALMRLHRIDLPPVPLTDVGPVVLYDTVCAGCHDTGAYAAPGLDADDYWEKRRRESRSDVLRRVIEGTGNMPPRGLCNLCTDQQLRDLVEHMLAPTAAAP